MLACTQRRGAAGAHQLPPPPPPSRVLTVSLWALPTAAANLQPHRGPRCNTSPPAGPPAMDPAKLPIRQYQQQIVDSVRANAVTVVIGELSFVLSWLCKLPNWQLVGLPRGRCTRGCCTTALGCCGGLWSGGGDRRCVAPSCCSAVRLGRCAAARRTPALSKLWS